MKKMYLVKKTIQTMFLHDNNGKTMLGDAAISFLKKEEKNRKGTQHEFEEEIKEISSIEEVPNEWKDGTFLWGTNEEITPKEFLNTYSEEYKEYLRLKGKFEND